MSEAYDTRAIAAQLEATHKGTARRLTGVDSLDSASGSDLSFSLYDDPTAITDSDAGAIICRPSVEIPPGETVIAAEQPRHAFATAADDFFGTTSKEGVHPTAVVEDGATIGEDCWIGPHTYIADSVTIGDNVTIRSGTSIGGPGFGYARGSDAELQRIPHQGSVTLEDNVEIGANCSIDRAVFEETVIETGTKLSGQVHLAHHVRLGAKTSVASHCCIAGGAVVGERVTVHPHVSVANDVEVGDDVELAMNAGVLDDVEPATTVAGTPATPIE